MVGQILRKREANPAKALEDVLRGEIRAFSVTTARECLGKSFKEETSLGLASDNLYISKVEDPDGSIKYTAWISRSLTGHDFVEFLNAAAPLKGSLFIGAILADWEMPDLPDLDSRRRTERHRLHLGRSWEIFCDSRKAFMNAMKSPTEAGRVRWADNLDTISGMKAIMAMNKRDSLAFFKRPRMLEELSKRLNAAAPPNIAGMSSKTRRKRFNFFFEALNPDVKKWILDEYHDFLLEKGFVTPFMRWKRDVSGFRTWDFDFPSISEIPPEARVLLYKNEPNEGKDPSVNPLVGLLAVAYFSPEIVAVWSQRQGYEGRSQIMGSAQIPVLVAKEVKDLMESNLLKVLERHSL